MTALVESRSILLGDQEIFYLLRRSPRCRSINLRVDERGLVVSASPRTSERRLAQTLRSATDWVLGKLAAWRNQIHHVPRFCDGETLHYLGEALPLSVRRGRHSAARDLFSLLVAAPQPEAEAKVREQVVAWYRSEAQRHFEARIADYAARLNVRPAGLTLSNAKTRWGSCNARGEIRLSWRLMQAPAHLVDYVVAHELAHLIELNHSPRFWEIVARIFPDYAVARAELDAATRQYMTL